MAGLLCKVKRKGINKVNDVELCLMILNFGDKMLVLYDLPIFIALGTLWCKVRGFKSYINWLR